MDYSQENINITGTRTVRCARIEVVNNNAATPGSDGPHFKFHEVVVTTTPEGETTKERDSLILTVDAQESFPIIDPQGNPTGQSMTHAQLIRALRSLYVATAKAARA